MHNSKAGHVGVETSSTRLQVKGTALLYMRTSVRHFIRQCACCQKMNAVKSPIKDHHFTVSSYQSIFKLNIDFIGPFNTKEESFHALTVIDCFTCWVQLYPVRKLLTTSSCISKAMALLLSFYQTEVSTPHRNLATAYYKQENSIVDRANNEINRHLTALFFDWWIIHTWCKFLSVAQRILNTNYFDQASAQLTYSSATHIPF